MKSKLDAYKTGTWVVTGGAGYLGRALALKLRACGQRVATLDNLSTSRRPSDHEFHEVDLRDWKASEAVWRKLPRPIHGVFHFAAKALVGESQQIPHVYFENNILSALNIARLCAAETTGQGVPKPIMVHSSSCAVYGAPKTLPLTEEAPLAPLSPYGASKRIVEEMLAQMVATQSLRVLNLRYFNPVGALEDGSHGECHDPETHLVPNAIKAALNGTLFEIFGDKYPTPDGTCLRDYFHLEDLVDAHMAAAPYLAQLPVGTCDSINVGSGRSTSVKETVRLVEEITGKKVSVRISPLRPGDPPHLEASIEKARRLLQWSPQRTLRQAIESHVRFLQKHHS